MPILEVKKICFSYEKHPLLKDVSFSVERGEIVTLIGPSGTGKTTVFNLLNGLITPHSGEIFIDGEPLPSGRSHLTYMMQDDLLLPWRTVLKNMTLMGELGTQPTDLESEAISLLNELGLSDCRHKYPQELSGGMRQRVALGRALLQKRKTLILDEPFASLDVSLREQMFDMLREIRDRHDATILMVTHDFHDAISLSDRVILLKNQSIDHEWVINDSSRNCPERYGILINELRQSLKT